MGLLDDLADIGSQVIDAGAEAVDAVSSGVQKVLGLPGPDAFPYDEATIIADGPDYTYARFPDGRIVIKRGPKGQKDLLVKPNTKAWKAINDLFEQHAANNVGDDNPAEPTAIPTNAPTSVDPSDPAVSQGGYEGFAQVLNGLLSTVDERVYALAGKSSDADRLKKQAATLESEAIDVLLNLANESEPYDSVAIGPYDEVVGRLKSLIGELDESAKQVWDDHQILEDDIRAKLNQIEGRDDQKRMFATRLEDVQRMANGKQWVIAADELNVLSAEVNLFYEDYLGADSPGDESGTTLIVYVTDTVGVNVEGALVSHGPPPLEDTPTNADGEAEIELTETDVTYVITATYTSPDGRHFTSSKDVDVTPAAGEQVEVDLVFDDEFLIMSTPEASLDVSVNVVDGEDKRLANIRVTLDSKYQNRMEKKSDAKGNAIFKSVLTPQKITVNATYDLGPDKPESKSVKVATPDNADQTFAVDIKFDAVFETIVHDKDPDDFWRVLHQRLCDELRDYRDAHGQARETFITKIEGVTESDASIVYRIAKPLAVFLPDKVGPYKAVFDVLLNIHTEIKKRKVSTVKDLNETLLKLEKDITDKLELAKSGAGGAGSDELGKLKELVELRDPKKNEKYEDAEFMASMEQNLRKFIDSLPKRNRILKAIASEWIDSNHSKSLFDEGWEYRLSGGVLISMRHDSDDSFTMLKKPFFDDVDSAKGVVKALQEDVPNTSLDSLPIDLYLEIYDGGTVYRWERKKGSSSYKYVEGGGPDRAREVLQAWKAFKNKPLVKDLALHD